MWINSGLILSLSDKKEELQKLADNEGNRFFLLYVQGNKEQDLIGTVICAFDGRRGYIHHVAVDPQYQGKGYGKRLMEKADQYYKEKAVVKVHIMIEKSNLDVINFYDKLGWFVRDDLVLMTKTLRDEKFNLD